MCQCKTDRGPGENARCNSEEICCKMQNAAIRTAIKNLRCNQCNRYAIRSALKNLRHVLQEYSCLPGTCLINRVKWVYRRIGLGDGGLYQSEKCIVNSLIAELKAFVESGEGDEDDEEDENDS